MRFSFTFSFLASLIATNALFVSVILHVFVRLFHRLGNFDLFGRECVVFVKKFVLPLVRSFLVICFFV